MLDSALEILSKGGAFALSTFILLALMLAETDFSFSQDVIHGHVVDKDNNGIPGVNVVIKGTTIGTVADDRGRFNFVLNDTFLTSAHKKISHVSFIR